MFDLSFQFIDVIQGNRMYMSCLYVYNKIDQVYSGNLDAVGIWITKIWITNFYSSRIQISGIQMVVPYSEHHCVRVWASAQLIPILKSKPSKIEWLINSSKCVNLLSGSLSVK